jgi:hypothetical protein
MNSLQYVKHETLQLKNHPDFTEKWLQKRIEDDPTILGLGELEVIGVEKSQPKAGRLDMLLRDPETGKRYEVEIMLGTVDESHIIRCLEYWDIERKRYPQYEHCAVLVAENITARFLNVIGLFNSAVPIMAIQLNALKIDEHVVLNFVKVLDEVVLGDEDEESLSSVVTDRSYWETKSSREMLALTDECVKVVQEVDEGLFAAYKKYYIGFSDKIRPNNFVVFRPRKKVLQIDVRISDREVWKSKLDEAGFLVLEGGRSSGRLNFTATQQVLKQHREIMKALIEAAYAEQD